MARKDTRYNREASDEAYNARRRFARKAKRYADMAEKATGAQKARYQDIARNALEDAISTYEKGTSRKEWSKNIRELDEKLKPVDVFAREKGARISKTKLERSKKALYSRDEQTRREEEAKSILSGVAGHRIFGATVDIWQGESYENREKALLEHFGASDMLEVIEAIESLEGVGTDLYSEEHSDIKYDELVALIAASIER